MTGKVDRVRVAETAALTDAFLDECGYDAALPPMPLLHATLREIAEEKGIDVTEHEIAYVAGTNLAWVWHGIDSHLLKVANDIKAAEGRTYHTLKDHTLKGK